MCVHEEERSDLEQELSFFVHISYGKIYFTWKHKPALGLAVWLHTYDSVYNTSWVSRSIHHTGRATLGHTWRTTLSVFGDPVLRVFATRRHPVPPTPCTTCTTMWIQGYHTTSFNFQIWFLQFCLINLEVDVWTVFKYHHIFSNMLSEV
jgi:hypothetical protein